MLSIAAFQRELWRYYEKNKRDLPWRIPESDGNFDPYKILVSEIMLQQTQVQRAAQKYQQFLVVFPTIGSLGSASLSEVLRQWQGLGYNRRAQYLREAASRLVPKDKLWTRDDLLACRGIGSNTAAAILAYSYNSPEIFIETNIRSVYLHCFFKGAADVPDAEILALVSHTIDRHNPREFYWALMDWGTYIKKTAGNPNKASRHYTRQTPFEGSIRQVRGEILRQLVAQPRNTAQLQNAIADSRLKEVLSVLQKEGLVRKKAAMYYLG